MDWDWWSRMPPSAPNGGRTRTGKWWSNLRDPVWPRLDMQWGANQSYSNGKPAPRKFGILQEVDLDSVHVKTLEEILREKELRKKREQAKAEALKRVKDTASIRDMQLVQCQDKNVSRIRLNRFNFHEERDDDQEDEEEDEDEEGEFTEGTSEEASEISEDQWSVSKLGVSNQTSCSYNHEEEEANEDDQGEAQEEMMESIIRDFENDSEHSHEQFLSSELELYEGEPDEGYEEIPHVDVVESSNGDLEDNSEISQEGFPKRNLRDINDKETSCTCSSHDGDEPEVDDVGETQVDAIESNNEDFDDDSETSEERVPLRELRIIDETSCCSHPGEEPDIDDFEEALLATCELHSEGSDKESEGSQKMLSSSEQGDIIDKDTQSSPSHEEELHDDRESQRDIAEMHSEDTEEDCEMCQCPFKKDAGCSTHHEQESFEAADKEAPRDPGDLNNDDSERESEMDEEKFRLKLSGASNKKDTRCSSHQEDASSNNDDDDEILQRNAEESPNDVSDGQRKDSDQDSEMCQEEFSQKEARVLSEEEASCSSQQHKENDGDNAEEVPDDAEEATDEDCEQFSHNEQEDVCETDKCCTSLIEEECTANDEVHLLQKDAEESTIYSDKDSKDSNKVQEVCQEKYFQEKCGIVSDIDTRGTCSSHKEKQQEGDGDKKLLKDVEETVNDKSDEKCQTFEEDFSLKEPEVCNGKEASCAKEPDEDYEEEVQMDAGELANEESGMSVEQSSEEENAVISDRPTPITSHQEVENESVKGSNDKEEIPEESSKNKDETFTQQGNQTDLQSDTRSEESYPEEDIEVDLFIDTRGEDYQNEGDRVLETESVDREGEVRSSQITDTSLEDKAATATTRGTNRKSGPEKVRLTGKPKSCVNQTTVCKTRRKKGPYVLRRNVKSKRFRGRGVKVDDVSEVEDDLKHNSVREDSENDQLIRDVLKLSEENNDNYERLLPSKEGIAEGSLDENTIIIIDSAEASTSDEVEQVTQEKKTKVTRKKRGRPPRQRSPEENATVSPNSRTCSRVSVQLKKGSGKGKSDGGVTVDKTVEEQDGRKIQITRKRAQILISENDAIQIPVDASKQIMPSGTINQVDTSHQKRGLRKRGKPQILASEEEPHQPCGGSSNQTTQEGDVTKKLEKRQKVQNQDKAVIQKNRLRTLRRAQVLASDEDTHQPCGGSSNQTEKDGDVTKKLEKVQNQDMAVMQKNRLRTLRRARVLTSEEDPHRCSGESSNEVKQNEGISKISEPGEDGNQDDASIQTRQALQRRAQVLVSDEDFLQCFVEINKEVKDDGEITKMLEKREKDGNQDDTKGQKRRMKTRRRSEVLSSEENAHQCSSEKSKSINEDGDTTKMLEKGVKDVNQDDTKEQRRMKTRRRAQVLSSEEDKHQCSSERSKGVNEDGDTTKMPEKGDKGGNQDVTKGQKMRLKTRRRVEVLSSEEDAHQCSSDKSKTVNKDRNTTKMLEKGEMDGNQDDTKGQKRKMKTRKKAEVLSSEEDAHLCSSEKSKSINEDGDTTKMLEKGEKDGNQDGAKGKKGKLQTSRRAEVLLSSEEDAHQCSSERKKSVNEDGDNNKMLEKGEDGIQDDTKGQKRRMNTRRIAEVLSSEEDAHQCSSEGRKSVNQDGDITKMLQKGVKDGNQDDTKGQKRKRKTCRGAEVLSSEEDALHCSSERNKNVNEDGDNNKMLEKGEKDGNQDDTKGQKRRMKTRRRAEVLSSEEDAHQCSSERSKSINEDTTKILEKGEKDGNQDDTKGQKRRMKTRRRAEVLSSEEDAHLCSSERSKSINEKGEKDGNQDDTKGQKRRMKTRRRAEVLSSEEDAHQCSSERSKSINEEGEKDGNQDDTKGQKRRMKTRRRAEVLSSEEDAHQCSSEKSKSIDEDRDTTKMLEKGDKGGNQDDTKGQKRVWKTRRRAEVLSSEEDAHLCSSERSKSINEDGDITKMLEKGEKDGNQDDTKGKKRKLQTSRRAEVLLSSEEDAHQCSSERNKSVNGDGDNNKMLDKGEKDGNQDDTKGQKRRMKTRRKAEVFSSQEDVHQCSSEGSKSINEDGDTTKMPEKGEKDGNQDDTKGQKRKMKTRRRAEVLSSKEDAHQCSSEKSKSINEKGEKDGNQNDTLSQRRRLRIRRRAQSLTSEEATHQGESIDQTEQDVNNTKTSESIENVQIHNDSSKLKRRLRSQENCDEDDVLAEKKLVPREKLPPQENDETDEPTKDNSCAIMDTASSKTTVRRHKEFPSTFCDLSSSEAREQIQDDSVGSRASVASSGEDERPTTPAESHPEAQVKGPQKNKEGSQSGKGLRKRTRDTHDKIHDIQDKIHNTKRCKQAASRFFTCPTDKDTAFSSEGQSQDQPSVMKPVSESLGQEKDEIVGQTRTGKRKRDKYGGKRGQKRLKRDTGRLLAHPGMRDMTSSSEDQSETPQNKIPSSGTDEKSTLDGLDVAKENLADADRTEPHRITSEAERRYAELLTNQPKVLVRKLAFKISIPLDHITLRCKPQKYGNRSKRVRGKMSVAKRAQRMTKGLEAVEDRWNQLGFHKPSDRVSPGSRVLDTGSNPKATRYKRLEGKESGVAISAAPANSESLSLLREDDIGKILGFSDEIVEAPEVAHTIEVISTDSVPPDSSDDTPSDASSRLQQAVSSILPSDEALSRSAKRGWRRAQCNAFSRGVPQRYLAEDMSTSLELDTQVSIINSEYELMGMSSSHEVTTSDESSSVSFMSPSQKVIVASLDTPVCTEMPLMSLASQSVPEVFANTLSPVQVILSDLSDTVSMITPLRSFSSPSETDPLSPDFIGTSESKSYLQQDPVGHVAPDGAVGSSQMSGEMLAEAVNKEEMLKEASAEESDSGTVAEQNSDEAIPPVTSQLKDVSDINSSASSSVPVTAPPLPPPTSTSPPTFSAQPSSLNPASPISHPLPISQPPPTSQPPPIFHPPAISVPRPIPLVPPISPVSSTHLAPATASLSRDDDTLMPAVASQSLPSSCQEVSSSEDEPMPSADSGPGGTCEDVDLNVHGHASVLDSQVEVPDVNSQDVSGNLVDILLSPLAGDFVFPEDDCISLVPDNIMDDLGSELYEIDKQMGQIDQSHQRTLERQKSPLQTVDWSKVADFQPMSNSFGGGDCSISNRQGVAERPHEWGTAGNQPTKQPLTLDRNHMQHMTKTQVIPKGYCFEFVRSGQCLHKSCRYIHAMPDSNAPRQVNESHIMDMPQRGMNPYQDGPHQPDRYDDVTQQESANIRSSNEHSPATLFEATFSLSQCLSWSEMRKVIVGLCQHQPNVALCKVIIGELMTQLFKRGPEMVGEKYCNFLGIFKCHLLDKADDPSTETLKRVLARLGINCTIFCCSFHKWDQAYHVLEGLHGSQFHYLPELHHDILVPQRKFRVYQVDCIAETWPQMVVQVCAKVGQVDVAVQVLEATGLAVKGNVTLKSINYHFFNNLSELTKLSANKSLFPQSLVFLRHVRNNLSYRKLSELCNYVMDKALTSGDEAYFEVYQEMEKEPSVKLIQRNYRALIGALWDSGLKFKQNYACHLYRTGIEQGMYAKLRVSKTTIEAVLSPDFSRAEVALSVYHLLTDGHTRHIVTERDRSSTWAIQVVFASGKKDPSPNSLPRRSNLEMVMRMVENYLGGLNPSIPWVKSTKTKLMNKAYLPTKYTLNLDTIRRWLDQQDA